VCLTLAEQRQQRVPEVHLRVRSVNRVLRFASESPATRTGG